MNSSLLIVTVAATAAFVLITALTLPPRSGNRQGIHLVYGLVVALIAAVATWYWHADYRVVQASKKAEEVLDGHYQPEAFIHVGMAFLERHRRAFPDAYARAVRYCELRDCLAPFPEDEESEEARLRMNTLIEVAIMLQETLRGIAPPDPDDFYHRHHGH